MLYQPTRPLPQTGHAELDAIRKAYMALGRNQFQPRVDRLAAFRVAAQRLRMAPLVATAIFVDAVLESSPSARMSR